MDAPSSHFFCSKEVLRAIRRIQPGHGHLWRLRADATDGPQAWCATGLSATYAGQNAGGRCQQCIPGGKAESQSQRQTGVDRQWTEAFLVHPLAKTATENRTVPNTTLIFFIGGWEAWELYIFFVPRMRILKAITLALYSE